MRFTLTTLLVGGASLVAAIPMRLVVVEHIGPVPAPRIGLAGSEAFNHPAAIDLKGAQEGEVFVLPNNQENPFSPTFVPIRPKHHDCGKKKNVVMAKVDDFSMFLKKLFGFGPIGEPMFRVAEHDHKFGDDYKYREHKAHRMMAAHAGSDTDDDTLHILPFMPGPVQGEGLPPPPPGSNDPNPPEFRHRPHRMWIHRYRPHSFIGRLHKAFLTLSPWEGRALSFVIGCGIGVLLRMLYVFSVLAYRCFFAQPRLRLEDRQEEEVAPAAESTVERQPLVHPPPPEYNEKGDPQ